MKYLLVVVLLFAGLLPGIAKADVILEGEHYMSNCLQIDNLSAYPDYDFVAAVNDRFPFSQKMTEGKNCVGAGIILAIKKVDWDKVQYSSKDTVPDTETAGYWALDPINAALFIPSGLDLPFEWTVPDTNPAVSVNYIVHIDAITSDTTQAHLVQTDITNKNGSTKTIGESSKSTEETNKQLSLAPESGSNLLVTITAVLIVLLGALGLRFAFRTWKK